jgi:hypothetical protein
MGDLLHCVTFLFGLEVHDSVEAGSDAAGAIGLSLPLGDHDSRIKVNIEGSGLEISPTIHRLAQTRVKIHKVLKLCTWHNLSYLGKTMNVSKKAA